MAAADTPRERLQERLRAELASAGGSSGAYVYDLEASRRRLLYSNDGDVARQLASNSKLFVSATFLNRFGGDGRLETAIYERGRRTGGRERTLKGSLVLLGDGDPALARPSFARQKGYPLTRVDRLARAVKNAGIRRVKGNVRADASIFDGRRDVPTPSVTPSPDDLATLSGLSFDAGYQGGHYASNPERNAGEALVKALRKRGVKVSGTVKVGNASGLAGETPLGVARSPTAAALIRQTNVPSDNFYAEMLTKRIGASPGKRGSTGRGTNRIEEFTRDVGSGVSLVNGSGLSRTNVSSPRNVVRLLEAMRGEGFKQPFFDSLAVAGRSGTLSDRMRGTAAAGRCRGKTGTLIGTSALSGYCRTHNKLIGFSILMENVSVDAARNAQDDMVVAIAKFR